MTGPRTLILDIETAPNVADVWGLFNQTVSLSQLRQSVRVMCWAAKWHGQKAVMFRSEHHHEREQMVAAAWAALDRADVLVTYNGIGFDYPHLCREFVTAGLGPPSPVKHVDLYRVVRRRFRFASNKLDHVAQQLGVGGKASHAGHSLWVRCMAGDATAWAAMRRYNRQDVLLTERVYDVLRPWVPNHPHAGLYAGPDASTHMCPNCGSGELTRQGYALTAVSKYQRYRCTNCGAWSRGNQVVERVETRSAA